MMISVILQPTDIQGVQGVCTWMLDTSNSAPVNTLLLLPD